MKDLPKKAITIEIHEKGFLPIFEVWSFSAVILLYSYLLSCTADYGKNLNASIALQCTLVCSFWADL